MISLITGGPGTGKTAWVINQILDLRKREPDRELYIHGIRNLRGIAHEKIYCRSQLCDICRSEQIPEGAKFVENWPQWKQPGSLIIVDEVQRIWRPRTGGSLPSEGVSGLETHRHYGLDFWLISQGPHLFDNFIRLLVGRHVHLVAKWSGRSEYEWPECKQEVQSRSDAVIRPYTLPKRVFSLYDSAEVHTKQEKRKPMSFYVVIAASVIATMVITFAVYRIKTRVTGSNIEQQQKGQGGALATPSPNSSTNNDRNIVKLDTQEHVIKALTPVIVGIPWTAPIYTELAKPVSMPIIKGCIRDSTGDKCACYTQQTTVIDMPHAVCLAYVQHHAFNPFVPDKTVNPNNQPITLTEK